MSQHSVQPLCSPPLTGGERCELQTLRSKFQIVSAELERIKTTALASKEAKRLADNAASSTRCKILNRKNTTSHMTSGAER